MHLNYFEPYQSKTSSHEDQLTRAYLVVLRYSPSAFLMFYDYVRRTVLETANEKKISIEEIPAISALTLNKASFRTQVRSLKDVLEAGFLISVLVTDEKITMKNEVAGIERGACYDGVISVGDTTLVIENKPRSYNVWEEQLSPSIKDIKGLNVFKIAAVLEWKQIIAGLNELNKMESLGGAEELLIEDFLQFVDRNFTYLNPFTSFSICKDEDALRKRCVSIMEELYEGQVEHHRGWKDSIRLEERSIKEIALSPSMNQDSSWEILLEMYPGDTMNQAREFHRNANIKHLLKLKESGWEIAPHMHYSFRASNLVWSSVGMSLEEYLAFWKKESETLNQVKRADFSKLFVQHEKLKLISKEDKEKLEAEFIETKRQTINICPGVKIKYKWPKLKATELDDRKMFVSDVKSHIDSALDSWLNKQ
jgi:hypothetical protein